MVGTPGSPKETMAVYRYFRTSGSSSTGYMYLLGYSAGGGARAANSLCFVFFIRPTLTNLRILLFLMANRWNEDDSDRLPEGMTRVGYDSDTQQYTFQDDSGLWLGEAGTEFGGEMRYIGPAPLRSESPQTSASSSSSYQILLPFFLIIAVFLLLVFRLVSTPSSSLKPPPRSCASGGNLYTVVLGDTCWDLALKFGVTVKNIERMNPGLDCAHLMSSGQIPPLPLVFSPPVFSVPMIAYSIPMLISLWMVDSAFAQPSPVFSQPIPKYTATYIPNFNTPQISEAGQTGTNECGTGSNQTSNCQNSYLNALDDFCLWAPPQNTSSYGDSAIGNTERIEVAWCLRTGYGTRLMPPGSITGAHWIQTPNYVQITGTGDLTLLNIPKNDAGGELDPHGADGNGNPIGKFPSYSHYHEWTNFMGAAYFCFRACLDAPGATQYCGHIWDTYAIDFSDWASSILRSDFFVLLDLAAPMGIYVSNGATSTFYQGEPVTPSAHSPGPSSSCTYYETLANYNSPAPTPTATYFGGSTPLVTSSGRSTSGISFSTTSGVSTSTGSPTSLSRATTSSQSSSVPSISALPFGSFGAAMIGVIVATLHTLM
ncbi:hypothetical protein BS47DRAFT_1393535 [Hydnum rufescens UP504]|uniref:LysM domain-containing protein n=1 Tax=Hydnum rufescens UP504 TaxID=1448309 RepID=A0A9P6AWD8_9AGAM|nr:hypothetical protein BS47DRAFT_1393535 [Hydnum rufescens UP504]